MSVRRVVDGSADIVVLEGPCPVEDAETLAAFLLESPTSPVDLSACARMHTAVLQVLLRLQPMRRGTCGDPIAARCLAWPHSNEKNGQAAD
ncbi:hypothetical protein [Methylobacterium planeticum]|uniref:Uncharacterized protein n=1 Tax=Methylobacterium planeticum TaxID=2615211 RepID=A0A6N6MUQ6_9HYPH|nr:hypothetical protein [Methylobacterium planeticum]KAB1072587.1 hypothetical protein F6X51_14950 [Methylobacterium planeticum]